MHRIFIAINLPEELKEELMKYKDRYFDLPVKWTKKENLHITLEFLGNIDEKNLPSIFKGAEDFAQKTPPFTIKLDKINYFPDGQMPKYIFATGNATRSDLVDFHVTLARVREWQWRQINPDEKPDVEEEIDLSFEVKSIEVMESYLKQGGPDYRVLKSYPLM
ncbi:MAG: RNA 2',3'-cyclic phosphodiesterase [bacterium]|nr:RNA 2',3'-cyclic phosphodiesterase [bacterium]